MEIKFSKTADYQLKIIRKLKTFKTGLFNYIDIGNYKFITNIIFIELNQENIDIIYSQLFSINNNLSVFCFNENNCPKNNWLLGEKILIINDKSIKMLEYN